MIFAVDVALFDLKGNPYRPFGEAEYEGPDADSEAMTYAKQRVALHRNAAACILIDGDPYAWVYNAETDYAGMRRRDTTKPVIDYVGRGMPDSAYA